MKSEQIAVVLKSFESPDEVRTMQKGRFELVHLGGMTIGRATYEPGWKWSEHVGPSVGAIALGAIASMTGALFLIVPGNLWPIVIAFDGAIIGAAVAVGAAIGALFRGRNSV